ncbi:MAG: hypothetical protein H7249_09940 [Chitinophagaceae bacterium]|nr:hypothetical protein [Oligoflexus sp.]
MRREAMYLGHPRVTFPLGAKIEVQSIGSGAKYTMRSESLQGWDLMVSGSPDQRPGYNRLSLLELWIEDAVNGRRIFGFAKFVQALSPGSFILRIIEIDVQNRDYLQELMHQFSITPTEDAV